MERRDLDIDTTGQELVDLTSAVADFVAGHGDGLVCVFVPHATAGVALFETGRHATDSRNCKRVYCGGAPGDRGSDQPGP